jgi:hypothetical protein
MFRRLFFSVAVTLIALAVFGLADARHQIGNQVQALATQVLEASASESRGFQPPMRAAMDFLVGRTLQPVDPKKSRVYLEEAYGISSHLDENQIPGLSFLADDLIRALAITNPKMLESSLPAMSARRDTALAALISFHLSKGDVEQAEMLFKQMQTEPKVDIAAGQLLTRFRDRPSQQASIFAVALRIYENNPHPYVSVGVPEDLASLTIKFWRHLPSKLVLEAADELLKQADPRNAPEHSQVRSAGIAASSSSGTVTFKNLYDFRVFQLLPILRQIDPVRADTLVTENVFVQNIFKTYPDGQYSLDPTLSDPLDTDREHKSAQYSIASGRANGNVEARAGQLEILRRIDTLQAEAQTDPDLALSGAISLPDLDLRTRALLAIADSTSKRQVAISNVALAKAVESAGNIKPHPLPYLLKAAELYLRIGDAEGAQTALQHAHVAAREMYESDLNPEDTNLALKLYWPSTLAWRDILGLAARVSPEFALTLVKDVPDTEIKAIEQVFLAGIWMGVAPLNTTSPLIVRKKDLDRAGRESGPA